MAFLLPDGNYTYMPKGIQKKFIGGYSVQSNMDVRSKQQGRLEFYKKARQEKFDYMRAIADYIKNPPKLKLRQRAFGNKSLREVFKNMSIKIYNVYRVCDNRIETVFKIKKELEPLYEKLIFSTLDQFGSLTLKGIQKYTEKGFVFWDIVKRYVLRVGIRKKFRKHNIKKINTPLNEMHPFDLQFILEAFIKQQRNEPFNFDASMVLIEYKGQIYVQFFGFHGYKYLNDIFGKYFDGLIKNGILADRHYQNSTDAENEDDWEDRKSMWNEIYTGKLDGYNSPVQAGFSHNFFSRIFQILMKYWKQKH